MTPFFFSLGFLPLGFTNSHLKVMFPLKSVWIPYFLQVFLKLSPSPCVWDDYLSNTGFFLVEAFPSVFLLGLWVPCAGLPSWLPLMLLLCFHLLLIYLLWILCMTQWGYLHWPCLWEYLWHYLAERLWWLLLYNIHWDIIHINNV